MPRYTKLNEVDEFDSDDDSVALIQGQPPPRLARFGGRQEYIKLDDLGEGFEDEEPDELAQRHKDLIHAKFQKNIQKSNKKMLIIVFLGIFSIVGIAVCNTIYKHNHRPPPKKPVLYKPLNPDTLFYNGTYEYNRTTLVISLDGLHPHYLSKQRTPNLHEFVTNNAAVPYMTPAFPSQTFPNHWTLVTGMFPINHGIVGNTFYDPDLDLQFKNTDPKMSRNRAFWGGEPIWQTAKKHGLRTAVHMWPGSEADWNDDEMPDEVIPFDGQEPLKKKLNQIVTWLNDPEPPHLMLTYVPNVDAAGHKAGINGDYVIGACLEVDEFIGDVVNVIAQRNLTDIVNLVVLSDHGMAPTSKDRLVFLDDIMPNYENVSSNTGYPLAGLRFEDKEQSKLAYKSIEDFLNTHEEGSEPEKEDYSQYDYGNRGSKTKKKKPKKEKEKPKGFSLFKSSSLPQDWNFTTGALYQDKDTPPVFGTFRHRLAPIYLVPDVGYNFITHEKFNSTGHKYPLKGVHGYDPNHPLMRALFTASGPAFPAGRYHPFKNVDVYSGICRSLGIPENPKSDGNFGLVKLRPGIVGEENYPGVEFETETLFGETTFDDFYLH